MQAVNLVRSSAAAGSPSAPAPAAAPLEVSERHQLLELCGAVRLCTWQWQARANAGPGLAALREWIEWGAKANLAAEDAAAKMADGGQPPELVDTLESMSEYAPLLLWSTSTVGRGALEEQLPSLKDAALGVARQLEDPVLTADVVAALIDFLLEDITGRSGFFVRALLALKQRRARAGAERLDFAHVIAVCDLFQKHLSGSAEAIRRRLPLDASPEASFTLACELLVDLFLAVFGEHIKSLSVDAPAAMAGSA